MGKNKRKRKLKEEDFKKKKLKVGKRLPMPDNVTITNFKAQTINILQQNLNQDHGDEPTNSKRQTLKDLLSSCSHYNTQAREEALVGLKNLIEEHPNVLKDNLGDILQRILGKITDIESSVRRVYLSLIWSIFKSLPESKISPFFPNVVAYLGCAMTHLNEGIRMDSMKFLDHCLHHYPRLLSTNSKNIILNLIDVISSDKGGQDKQQNTRAPGMLSLKAKVTSQKSQLEVLSRLNRLLGVIFSDSGDTSASTANGSNTIQDDSRNSRTITARNLYGATNPTSASPVVSSSLHGPFTTMEIALISNFSLKSASGGFFDPSTSPSDLFGNEVNLMDFISSLSPVLLEYWVECCPAEFAMNLIPVKKTSISLQIMKEVLEVFVTLIRGLEKIVSEQEVFFKFLKEKLFSQIYGHCFSVFPMSFTMQNAVTKKGGKKADIQGNQRISDVFLNLLICELLCYFTTDAEQEDGTLPKWAREVVNYLCEVLANKARGSSQQSQITLNDIQSLTKLVMVLILNLPVSADDLKTKLLKNVHQLFEAACGTSNTKKVLLQFLQDLLKHLAHREISQELKAILDIWLCSLLKKTNKLDFGSTFVHNIFSICKSGIVQKFPNIATVVKDALPCIFKTENFSQLGEATQLLVVEIFYHLKQTPSKQLYDVLIALCHSGSLSLTVFQYLMQVIYQASIPGTPDEQCSMLPAYLRFVLSILVGWPLKKLTRLQKQTFSESYNHPVSKDNILVTDPKDYYCYVSKDTSDKDAEIMKKEWQYQKSTTRIVCQYLMLSEFSETLLQMIAPSLSKLLNEDTALPLPVVYRLLYVVKTLLSSAKESHDEKKGLGGLLVCTAKWCSVVWHFSITVNTDSKHGEFFKTILKDFKELISELIKISSDILRCMLELLLTYTSHMDSNCTTTCQVLTDLFKGPLKDLGQVGQSSLRSLYKNLENAFNAGFVDSQAFSDFRYCIDSSKKLFSKM